MKSDVKIPKKQPAGLEWLYSAAPGLGVTDRDLWYLCGPGISDTVASGSKSDIEMVAAALNFSTNFQKFQRRSLELVDMLNEMSEFR